MGLWRRGAVFSFSLSAFVFGMSPRTQDILERLQRRIVGSYTTPMTAIFSRSGRYNVCSDRTLFLTPSAPSQRIMAMVLKPSTTDLHTDIASVP